MRKLNHFWTRFFAHVRPYRSLSPEGSKLGPGVWVFYKEAK